MQVLHKAYDVTCSCVHAAVALVKEGGHKVTEVFFRVIHSPVLHVATHAGVFVGVGYLAYLIPSPASPIIMAIAAIAGIITVGIHVYARWQHLLYEITLAWTRVRSELKKQDWFHKVHSDNIYLGGIPLDDVHHSKKLVHRFGLKNGAPSPLAVLSMVQNFELRPSLSAYPVQPKKWQTLQVTQLVIPAVDFKPLTQAQIQQGVAFIEQNVVAGIPTYVHCKAGVGRSATVVVAYLCKKYGLTPDQAIAFVKAARPQINLNQYQRAALDTYCKSLQNI